MTRFPFNIFNSRIIGGISVVLLSLVLSATADTTTDPVPRKFGVRRPSIILIVADGLGCGDLGCYGQKQILTPFIDKMASEGMIFRQFYAGGSTGQSSRASLLTGKTTGHTAIRGEGEVPLGAEEKTLGEILHSAGYDTAAIGEWGLGDRRGGAFPLQRGFDDWFGYLGESEAEEYYPLQLSRADKEHEKYFEIGENRHAAQGKYADDFFTEAGQRFIHNHKPDRFNYFKPFFLYLPFNIPRANKSLANRTKNGMQTPNTKPYSDMPWPEPEKCKAAMITRLDIYVGAIMETLANEKIEDNTLFILTSSTGPHGDGGVKPGFFKSAGSLRGQKGDLYEGGLRVPLIAWWSKRIKSGSVCDTPLALYDLLPTLTELAEEKAPAGIDGISFVPTLVGFPQNQKHDYLYWEGHQRGFYQAIRMGEWKGVRSGVDADLELYNLDRDASETNNVASKNAEITAKLTQLLKNARSPDTHWPALTASETAALRSEK